MFEKKGHVSWKKGHMSLKKGMLGENWYDHISSRRRNGLPHVIALTFTF